MAIDRPERLATRALSLLLVLVAWSCADVVTAAPSSVPPLDASFSERTSAPRGARVRWGGVVETINRRGAELTLLVRGHRLGAGGRPRIDSPSAGYFLVVASNRDAAAYAPGAVMTVVGRVAAEVTFVLEGGPRRLPVLRAELRELWPGRVMVARPAPAAVAYPAVPPRSDAGLWLIGSLALVGALIAADHSYLSIGIGHHGHYGGYGHYGYRGHHRYHYGHGHAHVGISGGVHF